ncbi:MAG: MFS transporter, partial [Christensenellaceae bacterium]
MERNVRHTLHASYLGYVTQAIVNNLSPLLFLIFRDDFAIPLGQITLLVTVNFCVQLTVDFLAANVADKIGYRPCIVAAHVLSAIGIASLAVFPVILPPFSGLLLAVFLYAIGGGLIEVLVSPIAEACPTDHKAAVMSLLHSFYCWGALAVILLTTLALQVFGKGSWQWLCLAWALLPAANAIFFSRVPLFPLVEQAESMRMGELFRSGAFWVFALLILCSGASEHAVSQWASAFA